MPPPIGRSNSNLGGYGASISKSRSETDNAKNSKRVDVVRTTVTEKTTTTQNSKVTTDRKGREHVDTKKATTTATPDPKIKSKLKEDPLLKKETSLFEAGGAKKETKGTNAYGISGNAYVEGPKFSMTGEAKLTRKGLGADIEVSLKVDANLIKAGASAEKEFKFKVNGEDVSVKVKLGAEGNVGINGEIKLKLYVGKDGIQVSAGAEGFVGARGSLSGSIDVNINGKRAVGGEIKVTAAAGAMAGADFELTKNSFKAKAYAAVGVGAGIEITGKYSGATIVKGGAAMALPGAQGWN